MRFSSRPSPLLRVQRLLAAEGQFAVALPEAERMARFSRQFASVVPAAVARACSVAAIQGETALLYCANGAAASRVRAQAKSVAQALTQRDTPVTAIRVKVRADWAKPEKAEKQGMPQSAIQAFRDLDENLQDGDLKTAVERLLAHRQPGRKGGGV